MKTLAGKSKELAAQTPELIVGEQYEFCNAPYYEWTVPMYYVGPVPPPYKNSQYKFLAHRPSQGHIGVDAFEFARPTLTERIRQRVSKICPDKVDEIMDAFQNDY